MPKGFRVPFTLPHFGSPVKGTQNTGRRGVRFWFIDDWIRETRRIDTPGGRAEGVRERGGAATQSASEAPEEWESR